MPKLNSTTLKKIARLRKLIEKYNKTENGVLNIIGRKTKDNDKLFNTVGELAEWLNSRDIYKEFSDKDLKFLNFNPVAIPVLEKEEPKDKIVINDNKLQKITSVEDLFIDDKNKENFFKLIVNADKILDMIDRKIMVKELEIPLEILELKSEPATIRVNRKILDEFYTVADRYPAYSRHAIINLAFKEFTEKYKK